MRKQRNAQVFKALYGRPDPCGWGATTHGRRVFIALRGRPDPSVRASLHERSREHGHMHGLPSLPGSATRVERSRPPLSCTLPVSRQGVHAGNRYATRGRGRAIAGGGLGTKGRQRTERFPFDPSGSSPVQAVGARGQRGWRNLRAARPDCLVGMRAAVRGV